VYGTSQQVPSCRVLSKVRVRPSSRCSSLSFWRVGDGCRNAHLTSLERWLRCIFWSDSSCLKS
jgi:hypothetical protein